MKTTKKAEQKPMCPFYVKEGSRCVLSPGDQENPSLRRYELCGKVACTVDNAATVDVSRPA